MMLAFVTATMLWTDFFRERAAVMPSPFSWITSALRKPWSPEKEVGSLFLLALREPPPLSVNVLCPLMQLCEILLMFSLHRLVLQLPENLGVFYEFEISLY